MNEEEAQDYVEEQGVVSESANTSVPNLAEAIVGEAISGSWWSHPRSQEIFRLSRALRSSPDILVCRLVAGKVTYVHRRLWPQLARLAGKFDPARICAIREIHTETGKHVVEEKPFPDWVPQEILSQAEKMSEEVALDIFGQFLPSGATNRSAG